MGLWLELETSVCTWVCLRVMEVRVMEVRVMGMRVMEVRLMG